MQRAASDRVSACSRDVIHFAYEVALIAIQGSLGLRDYGRAELHVGLC